LQGGLRDGDEEKDADSLMERMSANKKPARETMVAMVKFEFKCSLQQFMSCG